jgi:hypothetical protein
LHVGEPSDKRGKEKREKGRQRKDRAIRGLENLGTLYNKAKNRLSIKCTNHGGPVELVMRPSSNQLTWKTQDGSEQRESHFPVIVRII